jgi:hypothetical protein
VPLHYLNGLGSTKREEPASVAYQTLYYLMLRRVEHDRPHLTLLNLAVEIEINEDVVSSGKPCDLYLRDTRSESRPGDQPSALRLS